MGIWGVFGRYVIGQRRYWAEQRKSVLESAVDVYKRNKALPISWGSTNKLGSFFQILLTAEFAENAEETKSPSKLHQREFLHIKNLRALGVLGGKTTELALFFQIAFC